MNPQLYTQPLSDYQIDRLTEKDGLLETIPVLDLDLADSFIINNLNDTIKRSQDFYDDVNQYNLKNKRLKNAQMVEGKHLQDHKLYRHQTPYIDNEMFVGVDAIAAYVTAQTPRPEVYPDSDSPESKTLATDLEKALFNHSEKFELPRKMEGSVSNGLTKYIGLIKLSFDKYYGANGEIIPEVIDPNHVIVDHTAKQGANPRFICQVLMDTVDGLISKFPAKEKEILQLFDIKRKRTKNTSAELAYREVWFTYYDKDHKPQEAVCWYINKVVLDKKKNPHWLYEGEGKNFLDMPMKPYIPINFWVDGSNWIDKTSAVEQAVAQQDILNKLGRQIIDNLGSANGFKVIDSHAMSKDDAQNFTGDPNQLLLIKTKPNQRVTDSVAQLPPQMVSAQLIEEKNDARQTIHGILGTPSQFRGDDSDQTKTASEASMIKNQASGRQDKLVRAIDYAMNRYFNLLAQMMLVWYSEKHFFTVNGGDGKFDFIEMHRGKIKPGMSVRVQSGTTLPFDKARQEAVAQNAAELGYLSPYDYYKLMHMEQPQKLYDNLFKFKSNPQSLAMDLANDEANRQAVIDFTELMAGQTPEDRSDPTPDYIEQLRKLMISDDFLKAKTKVQNATIAYVKKALESLAIRSELDQVTAPPPPPLPPAVQATIPPPMPTMPGVQPTQPPGVPMQPPTLPMQGASMPQQPPQIPSSPIASIMQAQPPQPQGAPNLNPSQPSPSGDISQLTI